MMRLAVVLSTALLVLIGADATTASEKRPTLQEVEGEVYCPTCKQLLSLSSAPVADRMREFIQGRIGAGDTKSAIKAQLVDEFGQTVLAAPTREGFNALAWVLPLAGAAVAIIVIATLIRRWTNARALVPALTHAQNGCSGLDPDLERRIDEELRRYDQGT